jgi:hypothetical protein
MTTHMPGNVIVDLPKKNLLNLISCPSVTIPIPKAILHSVSFVSSLAAVEGHHTTSLFIVL